MSGQLVATNGIELWVERDGHGDALLLLGGADTTILRWPSTFVDALTAANRTVLRIEHRDSGLSTKIDESEPYRLEDMALDVAGVLDQLGLAEVDIVGYSMGAAIAQVLALHDPGRVGRLVLVASTPGLGDERLPFAADWFVDKMAERLFAPPPRTADDRVDHTVELYRMLTGSRYRFDDDDQRALATAEISRCWYPESGHGIAANASPSRLDRLDEIEAPTLVVHGTEDPVYLLAHGEALARGIKGAKLEVIDGLGHEVPVGFGAELAALVLSHLA